MDPWDLHFQQMPTLDMPLVVLIFDRFDIVIILSLLRGPK